VERNARLMGLDLGRIEAIVLSHGHFDHSEGLPKALGLIREENGGQTVPLHVHPGAFVKRAMRLPDGEILPLQDVPSRRALEESGGHILASVEPEQILGGVFYLSGEIPRKSFERGLGADRPFSLLPSSRPRRGAAAAPHMRCATKRGRW